VVEKTWIVVCLGSRQLFYGPFGSELEADEWLESIHATPSLEDPAGYCANNIEADEHLVQALEVIEDDNA
jgi:hypothetical protein